MKHSSLTIPLLTLPPLESGDKVTRAEFEQRYEAMTQTKKAELIEGVVYIASPVRITQHGYPHTRIMTWLGNYWAATPRVQVGDNTTVRLDSDNEPQPDALLRITVNGQSNVSEDGYVEGAPELIVEIAASSASLDLHEKLKVYRRNQVKEYLIWRVYDHDFDWFYLEQGKYIPLESNSEGIFCSKTFPGLWLAKDALLSGDLARVWMVLQQGIATIEHQNFVDC